MKTTPPHDSEQKQHHGREYSVAAISIFGEYLAVRYSITWLAWLAALFFWLALIAYTRKYLRGNPSKITWFRYGFRVILALAVALVTYWLTYKRAEELPTVVAQQPQTEKPPVQQKSEGTNSPNINIPGNQNQVIIYPPGTKTPERTETTTGFHEAKPEEFAISLGSVSAIISMAQLKKNRVVTPFDMYGVKPFKLSLGKHDELLFSFISWGNGVKVQVENNEVKIANPLLDRNFSQDAFEIVDKIGEPIFQMIRKPNSITLNGIFPSPTISSKPDCQLSFGFRGRTESSLIR